MKYSSNLTLVFIVFLWSFIASTKALSSDSIFLNSSISSAKVISIYDYQEEQMLMIDANIKIHLSDEKHKALLHEIDLFFITKVELEKRMRFLGLDFFKNNQTIHYTTKLSYSTYSKTYRLTNFRNHQTREFKSLTEALYTLGAIHHFPVTELENLHPGNSYRIKLKLELFPWKLPNPLIITAITQSEWQLNSDWHKIKIYTPASWY